MGAKKAISIPDGYQTDISSNTILNVEIAIEIRNKELPHTLQELGLKNNTPKDLLTTTLNELNACKDEPIASRLKAAERTGIMNYFQDGITIFEFILKAQDVYKALSSNS